MFLFAVGYSVGPQFFRGLKKEGLPQMLFAAVMCVFCLIAPFLLAKLMGYNAGEAAGLLAGLPDDVGSIRSCRRYDRTDEY